MERRLKERLIGACILVVLLVAIVPELLSGPKSPVPDALHLPVAADPARDAVRNVTVDLATSRPAIADGAAPPAAPQPTPEGTAPTASAATGSADAPLAPPQPMPATAPPYTVSANAAPANTAPGDAMSAGTASQSPETTAPLPTSGHEWAVQLGSFANRGNADNLVRQLKAQGFSIHTNAEGSGAQARYRVRVGPLANRDAAERVVAKLKGLGHAATIVSPR